MRRLFLAVSVALLVGIAAGLAVPRLWHRPQTLSECMMDRMKGQPAPMFAMVYGACQDEQKAEMTDRQVGLNGPWDDWKPVNKPNP